MSRDNAHFHSFVFGRRRARGNRLALALLPATSGLTGYIASLVVLTAGYGMFQTANNTAVMADVHPDQRGVVSEVLNLSRNLGLITGASVMGAVFAFAVAPSDLATAPPTAVITGMWVTFAVAAILIVVALVLAVGSRAGETGDDSRLRTR